jgi:hypothetical protein
MGSLLAPGTSSLPLELSSQKQKKKERKDAFNTSLHKRGDTLAVVDLHPVFIYTTIQQEHAWDGWTDRGRTTYQITYRIDAYTTPTQVHHRSLQQHN